MRYALFVCAAEELMLGEEGRQERLDAFQAFQAEVESRGALLTIERLAPTSTAKTVKKKDGGLIVADGPFAETKEQIAGFYVLECRDLDEAIELASLNPAAELGVVEVRPVWSD